ncbi:MAG: hypothetical protein IIA66_10855 [Planctomycetes bacterium]|nr:hypothetical protein [Planctomycetota bacterium]
MTRAGFSRIVCAAAVTAVAWMWVASALAQDPAPDPQVQEPATQTQTPTEEQPQAEDPQAPPEARPPVPEGDEEPAGTTDTPDKDYGLYVLIPPLVAIILAVITRQVLPSLIMGILAGAFMVTPYLSGPGAYSESFVGWRACRVAVETYLIGQPDDAEMTLVAGKIKDGLPAGPKGALRKAQNLKVILFTLLIGGMVGVLAANGGTRAVVQSASRWASNPQRGQIMGWVAGLVVFFDDYANSMIVGPTMAPIYDKLRISRQKLAYIVDSTAAPVASLALIGTWIGAEIGFIQSGLNQIGDGAPEFLSGVSAYQIFLYSIPYRFYAIFALLMVFLIGYSGRDFGAMKKAERRAKLEGANQAVTLQDLSPTSSRWWYAGLPILALVTVTITILFVTGWQECDPAKFAEMDWKQQAGALLSGADAFGSILYGAIVALLLAFVITLAVKALTVQKTVEAIMDGMSRMFPAVAILVLAWTLSAVIQDLQLAKVAKSYLGEDGLQFDPTFLPLVIFIASAIVSFATGTSWGTMGILCPVAVTVSIGLVGDLPADQAASLFYASVGSVLAGAVFGDHCSPISDTTVLSALACGCSLESHVWTQIPYALTAAVVAMACGDLLCSHFGQPWYIGLLAGTAALAIIVYAIGRKTAAAIPGSQ